MYTPSFVLDPSDEMSCFITGMSFTMLRDNMSISVSWFMLKNWKRQGLREKSRDAKRERSFDGGCSKGKLDIRLKRGFQIKFLSNFTMLVMIGSLTLSLKREEVLSHKQEANL